MTCRIESPSAVGALSRTSPRCVSTLLRTAFAVSVRERPKRRFRAETETEYSVACFHRISAETEHSAENRKYAEMPKFGVSAAISALSASILEPNIRPKYRNVAETPNFGISAE